MLKRLIDLTASAAALLILSPLIGTVALLIRMKLGSPVLFRQIRPGKGGKPFAMLKFRSMTDSRDAMGELLPDSERLTRFGRWLRSSSVDELPGLWNIMRGDMSLVGPRPLLMDYLPLYSAEQARRHDVKPGLTGWAQVNGRNTLSWDQKFALDTWYVDNQSLFLDIRIIAMTVGKVLRRSDISAVGEATMPRFTGTEASPPQRDIVGVPEDHQKLYSSLST